METCDQLEFDVVEVADTMGWQLPLVKRGLRQLQWSTGKGTSPITFLLKTFNSTLKIVFALSLIPVSQINLSCAVNIPVSGGGRSGVHVEFSSLSFYFRSYGDLSDEELDRVCRFLHDRVQTRENTQLFQLTACFKAFKRYPVMPF